MLKRAMVGEGVKVVVMEAGRTPTALTMETILMPRFYTSTHSCIDSHTTPSLVFCAVGAKVAGNLSTQPHKR